MTTHTPLTPTRPAAPWSTRTPARFNDIFTSTGTPASTPPLVRTVSRSPFIDSLSTPGGQSTRPSIRTPTPSQSTQQHRSIISPRCLQVGSVDNTPRSRSAPSTFARPSTALVSLGSTSRVTLISQEGLKVYLDRSTFETAV